MKRLVVVSNRVAPTTVGKPAAGGLAVAVQEALEASGGTWFGWSGALSQNPETTLNVQKMGKIALATVALSRRDQEEYYRGYSNSTLWPLFHYRLNLAEQRRSYFEGYLRVNAFFAKVLGRLISSTDLVWVHDYHLIPFAQALRAEGYRNRVGFFLHIPFPPADVLRACFEHDQLMRALCTYDVVGFQTENDFENFKNYIRKVADGEVKADGTVIAYGRTLTAGVFPIGIYPNQIQKVAAESVKQVTTSKLVRSLIGRSLMFGADRLDYSKGLDHRFLAYERLLDENPDFRGHITFIQIAPHSRAEVASYREIRASLEGLAGRINGRFTEVDWVPLRYLNKSFAREDLVGFLRAARVGVVTPLRDGMNLVAKEYIAAQDPEAPGALVLSEFAGAAAELQGAVLVNPYHVQSIADGMREALVMPLEERRARWQNMMAILRHNDLTAWRERFLSALSGPRQAVRKAAG